MKKEFKVFVVELFKGFDVVEEIVTSNLTKFDGNRLSKEVYEEYDDFSDSIEFDYDFVIEDEDDDCILYFVKEM